MRIRFRVALAAAAISTIGAANANTFPINSNWQIKGLGKKTLFTSDSDGAKTQFQVCVDHTVLPPVQVVVSKFVPKGPATRYTIIRSGTCSTGLADTFNKGEGIVLRLAVVLGKKQRTARYFDFAKGTFTMSAVPSPPKPPVAPNPPTPAPTPPPCPQGVLEHNGGSCGPR